MRDKLLLCAVLAIAGGAAACSHNDRGTTTPSASTAPSAPDMTAQTPTPPAELPSQNSSDCPMTVEGAQVTVDRMDGGVAYVFTTQTGDVAQLRDRVRKIAETVEHDQGGGAMNTPNTVPSTSGDTSGPSGGYPKSTAPNDQKDQNPGGLPSNNPSGAPGAQGNTNTPTAAAPTPTLDDKAKGSHSMSSVPAHAGVIDIDRGARLELRPLRSEDLDALRTHAEKHAAHMASGQCPTDQNAG